jgi:4-amino-4-deoxychorismate lyase
MRATSLKTWGKFMHTNIFDNTDVPTHLCSGITKLNVFYNESSLEIAFSIYQPRKIEKVKLVAAPTQLNYRHKYTDRDVLDNLLNQSGSDEIIIVRNGAITDTSKANIVFKKDGKLYTPNTFLLNGTMRQYLLSKGEISEKIILAEDIHQFDAMYFVNAMNPLVNSCKYDCKLIQ